MAPMDRVELRQWIGRAGVNVICLLPALIQVRLFCRGYVGLPVFNTKLHTQQGWPAVILTPLTQQDMVYVEMKRPIVNIESIAKFLSHIQAARRNMLFDFRAENKSYAISKAMLSFYGFPSHGVDFSINHIDGALGLEELKKNALVYARNITAKIDHMNLQILAPEYRAQGRLVEQTIVTELIVSDKASNAYAIGDIIKEYNTIISGKMRTKQTGPTATVGTSIGTNVPTPEGSSQSQSQSPPKQQRIQKPWHSTNSIFRDNDHKNAKIALLTRLENAVKGIKKQMDTAEKTDVLNAVMVLSDEQTHKINDWQFVRLFKAALGTTAFMFRTYNDRAQLKKTSSPLAYTTKPLKYVRTTLGLLEDRMIVDIKSESGDYDIDDPIDAGSLIRKSEMIQLEVAQQLQAEIVNLWKPICENYARAAQFLAAAQSLQISVNQNLLLSPAEKLNLFTQGIDQLPYYNDFRSSVAKVEQQKDNGEELSPVLTRKSKRANSDEWEDHDGFEKACSSRTILNAQNDGGPRQKKSPKITKTIEEMKRGGLQLPRGQKQGGKNAKDEEPRRQTKK